MKPFLLITIILTGSLLLSSCGFNQDTQQQERQNRYGWQGTENPANTQFQPTPAPETPASDTSSDSTDSADQSTAADTNEPETAATDTAPPAPPAAQNYPYATPVPGKAGFVTSPHAPYSGYVDVRGFPPGTEVKDPYTGKIFLVP